MRTIFIKPPQHNAFWITKGMSGNCMVFQRKPILLFGRQAGRIYRSLLQFDLSPLPQGLIILSARLACYIGYDECPGRIKTIDVYQIMSRYSLKRKLRRTPILTNSQPIDSKQTASGPAQVVCFDTTSLVQNWYSGAAVNLGILIKAHDETLNELTGLVSSRHPDSQQWPYLEIGYQEADASPGKCASSTLELQNNVVSAAEWQQTPVVDILRFNYSYIVVNTGAHGAMAVLQQSADGRSWQDESGICRIAAGQSAALIPGFIVKYARLCYKSQFAGEATALTIYLQGRTSGR